jgi:uncharacterized protein YkwD
MRAIQRVFTLALVTAFIVAAFAVPAYAGSEGTLLSRINSSRSSAGLPPVETYWDLTDDARAHSGRMMSKGSIYHNPSLSSVTSVWQALGENVGVGFDLNRLHDGFMNSSGHRRNILGDYNYVGIGVKTDDDGAYWVTVIFMRAAPGLNGGDDTTTTTVAPTTTTTAPPADPAPDTSPDPTPTTTTTKAPSTVKAKSSSSPVTAKASSTRSTIVAFAYSPGVTPIAD